MTCTTAIHILNQCRQRGITLYLDGDGLRFRGQRGAMTPELREAVGMYRAEIIMALATCPSVPWFLRRHDAEELLIRLHADLIRIKHEVYGGAFPPVKAGAICIWLEVCEGYVNAYALEAARGWDAMELLRGAVESCRGTARPVSKKPNRP